VAKRVFPLCCALIAMLAVAAPAQVPHPEDFLKRVRPGDTRFGASQPFDFQDHAGFTPLFDGKSLAGWDGAPGVWRVENGTIVGERKAGPTTNNDYLVYRGAKTRDFDLKVEIKVVTGGSGIQYRSHTGDPWLHSVPGAPQPDLRWMMTGPQADIWAPTPPSGTMFDGQVYIENSPRGIVAWRGEVTEADRPNRARIVGGIGDPTALHGYVSSGWNQYEIIARGGVVMDILNGQLMAVHIDDDPKSAENQAGLIGIEAEANPARVEIRQVWLKMLD
jgi:hypothetical protein